MRPTANGITELLSAGVSHKLLSHTKDFDVTVKTRFLQTRDELIQQKDAVILSLVSSLEEQMSSATSPRVAYGEESKMHFKPASMAQYPGTLQHGTYSEYRPEKATFSKKASVATGKYTDMESGLKPHSLGKEVSDVKSNSQQTESQKVKTVTEVASDSSKQSEQAHDTTSKIVSEYDQEIPQSQTPIPWQQALQASRL